MVIAGIISFALLDMLTSSMRTMSRAAADAQAYQLIEELTEYTRNFGFERLSSFKGQSFSFVLNRSYGTSLEGSAFHNRPLILDFVRRQWQSKVQANKFDGELTYQILSGPDNDSLVVAIDLTWNDPNTGQKRALGRVLTVVNAEQA